jgi:hypothetical protein
LADQNMRNGRLATAAKLYALAFSLKPELTEKNITAVFNAAIAASMAGCAKGEELLGQTERAKLRIQARMCLRCLVGAWRNRIGAGTREQREAEHRFLGELQADAGFARLYRDADTLAKMPKGLRGAWQQFWQDIEDLRKLAAAAKGGPDEVRV